MEYRLIIVCAIIAMFVAAAIFAVKHARYNSRREIDRRNNRKLDAAYRERFPDSN